MRVLILTAFLLLFYSTISYAQLFIDGVNLNRADVNFCEIIETDFNFFKKHLVLVDETTDYSKVATKYSTDEKEQMVHINFGQTISLNSEQRFQDRDGKEIHFSNAIDALNTLSRQGWQYVSSNSTVYEEVSVRRYLLQKSSR